MSRPYKINTQRPSRKKHIRNLIAFWIVGLGIIASIVVLFYKYTKGSDLHVSGPATTVGSVGGLSPASLSNKIDEATYSIVLPKDWKQINLTNTPYANGTTWQSDTPGRFLTIFEDNQISSTFAFNRLLPVQAAGTGLTYGQLSDNCSSFTTFNNINQVYASRWQSIDFNCNIPDRFNNVVGTGSGSPVNTVSVTGPTKGTHKYLFIYTDRSANPDYSVFYGILQSFQAK